MSDGPALPDELTVGGAFRDAWQLLRTSWPVLAGGSVLAIVAGFVAQLSLLAGLPFANEYGQVSGVATLALLGLLFLAHGCLTMPVIAGTVLAGVERLRGRPAGFATLAQGFRRVPRILGVSIGLFLITGIAGTLAAIPLMGGGFIAAALGSPLLAFAFAIPIVIGLAILSLRLMPALVLAIDPQQEIDASALGMAWTGTAGNGLRLFALYVLGAIIVSLCSMLFVVPAVLFGLPLAFGLAASVVHRLF